MTDVMQRPPPTKMLFEEDEDFFADLLQEAEMEGQEPDEGDFDDEDLYGPTPPISTGRVIEKDVIMSEVVESRPGVKEGKRPAVIDPIEDDEDEFEFGQEELSLTTPFLPQATTSKARAIDYSFTAQYSDLTRVNLNVIRPGYIAAAPISAVNFKGEKIVLKRRKRLEVQDDSAAELKKNSIAMMKLSSEMLEKPYQLMLNDIKSDVKLRQKQLDADATGAVLMEDSEEVESVLWTDRYRPKKFTDLLGDERVHRSALLWLKEWDQCVFKGSAKNSAAAEAKRERRKKRAREGQTENGYGGDGEEERAPDAFGRPQEKVLLLCGPPGLGKTTLAYVLARQAGYQVLEVNASDDRTANIVTERIRNALESTSLSMMGKKNGMSKPTCVIIDEIDGSGGGGDTSFVKTLVKLVLEGSSTRKYRGKGKKDRPLIRPIICICNDLYAPTLRALRPLARIIRFTPPTNLMLVKRLRSICDVEGLGADSKNLTMLTEIAEGDLRSCLNTLQFIKRRSTVVDEEAIKSTMVGMKDTGTSVSAVWDRLFKKPPRKKGGGGDSDEKYVNRLVKDLSTCGEYDKISQGCFENYLSAKSTSDDWAKITEVHDWLFLYDRLDGRLKADRDYELLPYVPYTFVPWYKLFSSHTARPIEFPKADYEAYLKRTAHQEIAEAFALNIPRTLKNMFTASTIASELLPFINRILNPDLKPINSQLIKKDERDVLMTLVNHLLTMKLSFVQDRNEEGQLSYKLDPPIDVFVHFDGKRAIDLAPSRYAVRHLISHEMEIETLRRTDGGDGSSSSNTRNTSKSIIDAYKPKDRVIGGQGGGGGGGGGGGEEVKEAMDFFGRPIVVKYPSGLVDESGNEEHHHQEEPKQKRPRAIYKFHEGFSNAVRVTKRISDFL